MLCCCLASSTAALTSLTPAVTAERFMRCDSVSRAINRARVGFAASWRTPENQRLQLAVPEQPPYQLFGSHHLLLAHKLVRSAGAHAFRQRCFCLPARRSKKVLLFQYSTLVTVSAELSAEQSFIVTECGELMADSLIITSDFKGFERNLTPCNLVCQCRRLPQLHLLLHLVGARQQTQTSSPPMGMKVG